MPAPPVATLAERIGADTNVGTGNVVAAVCVGVAELPLSGTTRAAERRSAELAVEAAQARVREQRERVQSQVHTSLVEADAARRRLALVQNTVRTVRRQVKAQQRRYAGGAAIFMEVQQAEDSLRRAELSVERARVDFARSAIALDHLIGGLLARHAHQVPRPPEPRAGVHSATGQIAWKRSWEF